MNRQNACTVKKIVEKRKSVCKSVTEKVHAPIETIYTKIEKLWQILSIPVADQVCFKKFYFENQTPDALNIVKQQEKLLRKYKEKTVCILREIENRESLLADLNEFLHNENLTLTQFAQNIASKLVLLRKATICVLELIHKWRKLMWDPHPFIWNGQNYISKISQDFDGFLDSIMFVKLQIFVADFIFFVPQASVPIIDPTEEDEFYMQISLELVPTHTEKNQILYFYFVTISKKNGKNDIKRTRNTKDFA